MKLKQLFLSFLAVTGFYAQSMAQIYVAPAMPDDQDSVVVTFDATLGNAGLANYTGDIYAHTGVITSLSTSNSDWKYVKSGWGVNIPECKLTSLGNHMYKLRIYPAIRQYYGVPAGEQILKMAFVFRSDVQVSGAWLEGKTSAGGDIFWDVYPSGLSVNFTNPSTDFLIVDLNAQVNLSITSSFADTTFLYYNNLLLTKGTGNTLTYNYTANTFGAGYLKTIAKNDTASVADSVYLYVKPAITTAALPAGVKYGINYISNTSVILCLHAPLKQNAFVIGSFNNWLPTDAGFMNRTPDGKDYWVELQGLIPGQKYIYQYLVDGSIRVGDPYCEKISDPWDDQYITPATYPGMISYPFGKTQGRASVLQTAQQPYVWQSGSFTPPAKTDLVVYELLVRDFTEAHTFQAVIDTLGYLKNLGINAIELMPVGEFEGNISWGYNPSYYFAVDKYYGPANILKRLIDTCHQLGIAVILDAVLNHSFGSSPYVMLYWDNAQNRPAANSPYYNPVAKHDFNVGFDFNHESAETKRYVSDILKFWLTEYRFDGYRFDLSKGFTQTNTLGNTAAWGNFDAGRIATLTSYWDTVKATNPNAFLILEHFADNSEEKELSNRGMMIWGNMNGAYRYASIGVTSGTNSNLSWGVYTDRGWSSPNLVTYMESHDEERQMFNCLNSGSNAGTYNIKDTIIALRRMALNGAFFFTLPGPKMIYEFGERGFDYSINWPSMTSSSRLDPKPPRWDYLANYQRSHLMFLWSEMIKLKTQNPLFETTDFELDLTGMMKKVRLHSASLSAIVLGNFGTVNGTIIPKFYNTGYWYNYFTGDSINVTNINGPIVMAPGEYRIYTSSKLQTPIGVNENIPESRKVLIYPNPASSSANILFLDAGSDDYTLSFYNLSGKKMDEFQERPINGVLETQWTAPCKGLFIIKIKSKSKEIHAKILFL
jgi:glycosidase